MPEPKRSPGRPRGGKGARSPRGEATRLCGFQVPLRTLAFLDEYRSGRGWSRGLALRSLLDEALAAKLPGFTPPPPPLTRARRKRGRPAGSVGRQTAEPRPLTPAGPRQSQAAVTIAAQRGGRDGCRWGSNRAGGRSAFWHLCATREPNYPAPRPPFEPRHAPGGGHEGGSRHPRQPCTQLGEAGR